MHLEQSVLIVLGGAVIPQPTLCTQFNITDCPQPKIKSPWGTHPGFPVPLIIHQVHPSPWAKSIPDGLRYAQDTGDVEVDEPWLWGAVEQVAELPMSSSAIPE